MGKSLDSVTVLTKSELHQKFKKIKKALWLDSISIQSERVKVIKERLEYYTSMGNKRKTDIYQRKLDGIVLKI